MRRRFIILGTAAALATGLMVTAPAASAGVGAPAVSGVHPTSGTTVGGTRVSVFGSRFSHVRAVKFGKSYGTSIRVVSSTHLYVTAPKHPAGVVDIRVVTAYGTSAIRTQDHYTYVSPPYVSSASPRAGTTGGGTRVTVTGANFIHVKSVTFSGVAGKKITVLSKTKLTVTAPAHAAGAVNVRVTTSYGTSAPVTADRFTYVIPVTGTVTADVDGSPLAGITVFAFDVNKGGFASAVTAGNGKYTLPTLQTGTYVIGFDADGVTTGPSSTGYVSEWFNNIPMSGNPTFVTVTSGHTVTANAGLASGGLISGTISTSDAGALQDVDVVVFDTSGNPIGGTTTNAGTYQVTGVPAGSNYVVCFDTTYASGGNAHGYNSQCWNNVAWGGNTAQIPAGTTPVPSTPGTPVTGINAVLTAKP